MAFANILALYQAAVLIKSEKKDNFVLVKA